jgi:hypothetical protein
VELYAKALKLEKDPDKKSTIMSYAFKAGGTWDL